MEQVPIGDIDLVFDLVQRLTEIRLGRLHRHFCLHDTALIPIEQWQGQTQIQLRLPWIIRPVWSLHRISRSDCEVRNPVGLGQPEISLALRHDESLGTDIRSRVEGHSPEPADIRIDPFIIKFGRQLEDGHRREPEQLAKIRPGCFTFLKGLDHLRLKVDELQADPDQIHFSDVALLEADGVHIKNTRKAIPVLLGQRQSSLGQLSTVVGVLHREGELPDRVLEGGFDRLCAEPGTFDAIASLPGQFKELLNLAKDPSAVTGCTPLNKRSERAHRSHRIGKQPGGNLLPFGRFDPELGYEQIEILS